MSSRQGRHCRSSGQLAARSIDAWVSWTIVVCFHPHLWHVLHLAFVTFFGSISVKRGADMEGRHLVLDMIASLRGDRARPEHLKQFQDLNFPHTWTSVCERGSQSDFLPDELKHRVVWKQPHDIGTRGIKSVVMHPNGNIAGGERTAYSTGRLADTERYGWLSASFCCVSAQATCCGL